MTITSRRPSLRVSVAVLLSYLLVISLWVPFAHAQKLRAHGNVAKSTAKAIKAQTPPAQRNGELLVRFRANTSQSVKDTIMATHGARRKKQLQGESGVEQLQLPEGRDPKKVAFELLMNPQVEFAEPNFLIAKDDVSPNDAEFGKQWSLRNTGQDGGQYGSDINAVTAWQTTTGSTNTVIAVVDSGIDFTHPDLKNNRWTNPRPGVDNDFYGWDYVTDSGVIKDEQGHGTAVAGIIAAEGNNSTGITGVMWRASLMSLRVLDNTGTGDIASAVEAIDYAVTHGAQVINLSWGTTAESMALKDAIQRAIKRQIVVVCSAGNSGKDLSTEPYYPSSFALKGLIAVGASDNFDELASWSNWGMGSITVAAPGKNILTTQMGGGYWNVTGTSAAAPVVSGIAGLLKTANPGANALTISKAIADGARRNVSLSGKVSSGGVVNAADALAKLHGGGNQSPRFVPPANGGNGSGSGFDTTPPPTTIGAPGTGMPNLDQERKAQAQKPATKAPIQSNLPCADCDPTGGGGGGGYYPPNDPNFSTARRRPGNETGRPGVNLGSRNFNGNMPLLYLPGRGVDLNLTLTYNSLVWTKDGTNIKFNADFGTPAPGFRLGLPTLQQRFLSAQTNIWSYILVTPGGSRIELRQVGTSTIYESEDNTYTQLNVADVNNPIVRTTDGTQLTFTPVNVNGEYRCREIKDRNGNYITASYNTSNGHLQTIRDTLGRDVTFVYDASSNLTAIRQTWNGVTHDWATFYYGQVWVAPAFGGGLQVNGPNNAYTTVLTQVNLHDGSYFTFQYNSAFAQVNRINRYAADGHLLQYTSYNMNSAAGQTDCPRFTERRDWAENWNSGAEAVTQYSVATDGTWAQQTMPNGTIHKEWYATNGWAAGLLLTAETWVGGVKKKFVNNFWVQNNMSLTYPQNPRVTETNVYDVEGNHRRISMTYYPAANFNLPMATYEYAADGVTLVRRTHTNYNWNSAYIDRRIIGLPSGKYVFDGNDVLYKFDVFDYDYGGSALVATPAQATQHDPAYGTGFLTGRANLSLVRHANANDPANGWQDTVYAYNTTGSVVSVTDTLWRQTTVSYTDSFSDGVNRNTFAFPTTVTDPDGFQSQTKYNYDYGAVTWVQTPSPNAGQTAPSQTLTYDSATRLQQITNGITGAYVRWVYPTSQNSIQTYSTIVTGAGEAYSIEVYDGAGRVRANAVDHPGSVGLYSGEYFIYDNMGRLVQQSKPTEMNASWVPTGDDSSWVYTYQAYDWKGRPTVTTLPNGSTRENIYGGCGCAGGEVVTTRDENGRRKRYTSDIFGRLKQVDELNWNQTVYATTTYAYNVRNQLTSITQGNQTRTLVYDGRGRLQSRTTPEQGTTTYSYNNDDTLQTMTDARGATTTLSYNNRQLITGITYGAPGNVAATPNVTFTYDGVGNRKTMTDGLGSVSYTYDQMSRLTNETRTFNGLAGSYALNYAYNLGDQLTSMTNQWGAQVGYNYDKTGRPTSVSGSGYFGVSSYINNVTYRAFGPKQIAYGDGRTLSLQYDNRLRLTEWSIPNVLRMQYSYLWEQSGRVEFARNLDDETLDRWFAYDHVGRLTVSRSGNEARLAIGEQVPLLYNGPYSHGYSYDQFGNITQREGWGGTNPAYTVSFTNNKMNGHTYDASGNLTDAGGGWTFTYNANNQQATSAVNGVINVYDGDGFRGKKTESGGTVYYLRSTVLGGQIVAEIASNGDWARGYVYVGSELLAVQQAGVFWVHQDPVVKSKRVTNSSGAVISTIELDPWGGETNRSSNEAFQPRKFNGYLRDGIGSDDAMQRRYNRWWTRFEQADPTDGSYDLTDPQSFNRFAYVQNDPVNLVDPSGLMPCVPGNISVECDSSGFGGWGWGDIISNRNSSPGRSIINAREEMFDRSLRRYSRYYSRWLEGFPPPWRSDFNGSPWGGYMPEVFPCPPTAAQLLQRPEVQQALTDAFNDSGMDTEDEHEEGGWIYMNRHGELTIVRAERGTASSIDLNNPPHVAGSMLVADFHTHPGKTGGPVPGRPGFTYGNQRIPSPADTLRSFHKGSPGIVKSRYGIKPFGPKFRGANPRKAFKPPNPNAGISGYAGNTRNPRCK